MCVCVFIGVMCKLEDALAIVGHAILFSVDIFGPM